MPRLVAMSTNVVASHALCGGSSGRIGTSSTEVIAPANVAFALQPKIEFLQLFRTVLLSPSGLPFVYLDCPVWAQAFSWALV